MPTQRDINKTKKWMLSILGVAPTANIETPATVLDKTNTIAYTPTQDYHPATKKYVDDTVGDIATVLENI